MEDLREVTHGKHFEQYRRKRLEEMGFADDHGWVCPYCIVHVHNYIIRSHLKTIIDSKSFKMHLCVIFLNGFKHVL